MARGGKGGGWERSGLGAMISVMFSSKLAVLYLVLGVILIGIGVYIMVFNPIVLPEYGLRLTGLSAPMIAFGLFVFLTPVVYVRFYFRSKKESYLESGQIFPNETFDEFVRRGDKSRLSDGYYLFSVINCFPFKAGEALVSIIVFLVVMVVAGLIGI